MFVKQKRGVSYGGVILLGLAAVGAIGIGLKARKLINKKRGCGLDVMRHG